MTVAVRPRILIGMDTSRPEAFSRGVLAALSLSLIGGGFLWYRIPRFSPRLQQPDAAAARRLAARRPPAAAPSGGNRLAPRQASGVPVEIDVQPPSQLNFKSREEIYSMRTGRVMLHRELISGSYAPNPSVFGAIEDGKPWWGLEGLYGKGWGEESIGGPASHSRLVLNPYILVGVVEGTALKNPALAGPGERLLAPYSLLFDRAAARADVFYEASGHERLLDELGLPPNCQGRWLWVAAYNARDLGFNFISIDRGNSQNIAARQWDTPMPIVQFFHRGGSCGYRDGCNNLSPSQALMEILPKDYPAVAAFKLWRDPPSGPEAEADFTAVINLR